MIKAIILDFDGTMIDSESLWHKAYDVWLKENHDHEFPLDLFIRNAGSDGREVFAELERRIGHPVAWKEMQDWSYSQVHRWADELELLPGVMDVILQAKEKGLKISTGTSSRAFRVIAQLERLDVMKYFDALSTVDLVAHAKPHPDIFLKAAELLGVEPQECLVIEDSANGVAAATAAGMPCLIVPNDITRTMDFSGAYQVLDSLEQIDLEQICRDLQREF